MRFCFARDAGHGKRNEQEIPGPPGEADPRWGLRGLGPEECQPEIWRFFRLERWRRDTR